MTARNRTGQAQSQALPTAAPSRARGVLGLEDEGRQTRLAALVLALIVFLIYLPTILSAEFVDIDDGQYVLENEAVRNPSRASAWRFLSEVRSPSTVVGYYQPLTMISLMVDAWLSGESPDPMIFHLTSVLLHVLNTLLVFAILRALFGSVAVPALAALLFGLHPVQVESVAWVSQRKTLLASGFSLAAVWLHIRYAVHRRKSAGAAALLCFLLALISKPTAMLLPIFILLLDVWPLRRGSVRTLLIEKLPWFAVMVAGMWVAYVSQAATAGIGAPNWSRGWDLLRLCSYNVMLYAGNVAWPTNLSLIYPLPQNLSAPAVLGSLIATAALALAWAGSWRWSKAIFVGLGGAAALLGVALGPVRFMQSCIGDRFLYLPMAALLLVPAATGTWMWRRSDGSVPARRGVCVVLAVMASLACVPLNWKQQETWSATEPLWSNVLRRVPAHGLGNAGLAGARLRAAQEQIDAGLRQEAQPLLDEALVYVDRARAAEPENGLYEENRAEILMRLGRGEEAVAAVRRGLELGMGPMEMQARVALGRALCVSGRVEEARTVFDAALVTQPPPNLSLRMQMGYAMLEARQPAAAAEYFTAAAMASPGEPNSRAMRASALAAAGDWGRAAEAFDDAIKVAQQRGVETADLDFSLAKVMLELGRADEAEILFLKPEVHARYEAECRLGVAGVAALRGRRDEALSHLRAALQMDRRLTAVAQKKHYFQPLHDDPRWKLLFGSDSAQPATMPAAVTGRAEQERG